MKKLLILFVFSFALLSPMALAQDENVMGQQATNEDCSNVDVISSKTKVCKDAEGNIITCPNVEPGEGSSTTNK